MSADPVLAGEQGSQRATLARVLAADSGSPEGNALRQQVIAALLGDQAAAQPQAAGEPEPAESEGSEAASRALDVFAEHVRAELRRPGTARKVSVSMPADLTAAVQARVGRGRFSQYVTEAVGRQLELDLLGELSDVLAAEHGPVPEKYLAEARAAWPDGA
jgi:hypothetical protein